MLQIGVLLNGTTVLDTVIGGPGYNSRQLAAKDVILKIDGVPVTAANINSVMTGTDIPGSPVMLTVAKGGFEVLNRNSCILVISHGNRHLEQGPQLNVLVTRMTVEEIQDRQRMFELLDLLQARSHMRFKIGCMEI